MRHVPPGPRVRLSFPIRKSIWAGDHHPVLFVWVPMLGHDGIRVQLHHRQRDEVALHAPHANALEDLDWRNLFEVGEICHWLLQSFGFEARVARDG